MEADAVTSPHQPIGEHGKEIERENLDVVHKAVEKVGAWPNFNCILGE